MSLPTPVPVVCAVIRDDLGRVLLAQRPAHKHLGMKWEFPGGKVERHEPAEAALIREIKEELGCELLIERGLPSFTYDYGSVVIEMIPFLCRLTANAAPHPHEHRAIEWVKVESLNSYDLAPADWPVVAAVGGVPSAVRSIP